jgi:uncharacterized membrane protein
MFEESLYKWLGWVLFAISLAMLFTPYPEFPWAIVGLISTVLARVVRLERHFKIVMEANRKTLTELSAFADRLGSAVRDEQVP